MLSYTSQQGITCSYATIKTDDYCTEHDQRRSSFFIKLAVLINDFEHILTET